MTRSLGLAAALLLAGVYGRPLAAQSMELSAEVQWDLYDKILSFDRRFGDRGEPGSPVVVGILYQERFRPSNRARLELLDMNRRGSMQLSGRPVRFVSIEVGSAEQVEARLVEGGVDVVYFTPLQAAPVSRLVEIAVQHAVVTLTGVRAFMDQGVGVGLGLRDSRPEILVNLELCRAQGMELRSDLLRLVTIVPELP